MECKKCKGEVDTSEYWSSKWRLCDDCQAAEEDRGDALKEERLIERLDRKNDKQ